MAVVLVDLRHQLRPLQVAVVVLVPTQRMPRAGALHRRGEPCAEGEVLALGLCRPLVVPLNTLPRRVAAMRPLVHFPVLLGILRPADGVDDFLAVYRFATGEAEALRQHLELVAAHVWSTERLFPEALVDALAHAILVLGDAEQLTRLHRVLCGAALDASPAVPELLARQLLPLQAVVHVDLAGAVRQLAELSLLGRRGRQREVDLGLQVALHRVSQRHSDGLAARNDLRRSVVPDLALFAHLGVEVRREIRSAPRRRQPHRPCCLQRGRPRGSPAEAGLRGAVRERHGKQPRPLRPDARERADAGSARGPTFSTTRSMCGGT
mmetsp:Transcript_21803/g.61706  ORF Transcript_21803/g.61706 Transcript_21803/m.61706 type:complete len:323 (+) Transcript_21803:744-1712(+)